MQQAARLHGPCQRWVCLALTGSLWMWPPHPHPKFMVIFVPLLFCSFPFLSSLLLKYSRGAQGLPSQPHCQGSVTDRRAERLLNPCCATR